MFHQLNHQKLQVCQSSGTLLQEWVKHLLNFLPHEKCSVVSSVSPAALAVTLNRAAGVSVKPEAKRKRYFKLRSGSLTGQHAAFNLAGEFTYFRASEWSRLGQLRRETFNRITTMLSSSRESNQPGT
jgi:hypothetical protein